MVPSGPVETLGSGEKGRGVTAGAAGSWQRARASRAAARHGGGGGGGGGWPRPPRPTHPATGLQLILDSMPCVRETATAVCQRRLNGRCREGQCVRLAHRRTATQRETQTHRAGPAAGGWAKGRLEVVDGACRRCATGGATLLRAVDRVAQRPRRRVRQTPAPAAGVAQTADQEKARAVAQCIDRKTHATDSAGVRQAGCAWLTRCLAARWGRRRSSWCRRVRALSPCCLPGPEPSTLNSP